ADAGAVTIKDARAEVSISSDFAHPIMPIRSLNMSGLLARECPGENVGQHYPYRYAKGSMRRRGRKNGGRVTFSSAPPGGPPPSRLLQVATAALHQPTRPHHREQIAIPRVAAFTPTRLDAPGS